MLPASSNIRIRASGLFLVGISTVTVMACKEDIHTVDHNLVVTVTVIPSEASVMVGATQQFTAALRRDNGNLLTGRTVEWTSNNSGVSTVSSTGLATGMAAGTATITATSEGRSGEATLTVLPPVENVKVIR